MKPVAAFVRLPDGRDLHLRYAGSGPALVLLHPSPLSSALMTPWIQAFARDFSVYAFDTPGYGASDPLRQPARSLQDYLPTLEAACDQLKLQRVFVFGQATGAQLGIAWAKRHPARIAQLFLDAACHFEPAQRAAIMRGYFPSLSMRADGAHLTRIWHIVERLFQFFPWFDTRTENRIHRPEPPLAAKHAIALEYARAGGGYAEAYRLAFEHEDASQLSGLQAATHVIGWRHSLVHPYTEQLLAHTLPDVVKPMLIECSPSDRYQALATLLRQAAATTAVTEGHAGAPRHAERRYLSLQGMQIYTRRWTREGTLYSHKLGESSALLAHSGSVFDWPGHGLSGPLEPHLDPAALLGSLPAQVASELSLPNLSGPEQGPKQGPKQGPQQWAKDWPEHCQLRPCATGAHFMAAWRLAERHCLNHPPQPSDQLGARNRVLSTRRTQARALALLEASASLSLWLCADQGPQARA